MGLMNYTTEIPVDRTISEIEKILSMHKAQRILKEYDGAGTVTSISFIINTDYGPMPFKLPMNQKAVMQVINNQTEEFKKIKYGRQRIVPRKFKNDMEQAKRVGWRIIRDWLEAQCALLELEMVKVQEIFLPYVVMNDGKTFYEQIEDKKFKGMLLIENGGGGQDESDNRV